MKKIQALLGSFAFLVTVVAVHAEEAAGPKAAPDATQLPWPPRSPRRPPQRLRQSQASPVCSTPGLQAP